MKEYREYRDLTHEHCPKCDCALGLVPTMGAGGWPEYLSWGCSRCGAHVAITPTADAAPDPDRACNA